MRTPLTVICDGAPAPTVYKAWTEDISACGVQFSCDEEIDSNKVLVRLLLPGLEDKLVECHLVRSGNRRSETLIRRATPRFFYGARFERVLSMDESQDKMAYFNEREERVSAMVG
jgi:hypothetical protein